MTIATDSLKALAARTGLTIADIREAAKDLGLRVTYAPARHTWIVAEDATTVRRFNEHLNG